MCAKPAQYLRIGRHLQRIRRVCPAPQWYRLSRTSVQSRDRRGDGGGKLHRNGQLSGFGNYALCTVGLQRYGVRDVVQPRHAVCAWLQLF